MNKLLMIVVMSIGLSSVASAGGIYDGIWAVDGDMIRNWKSALNRFMIEFEERLVYYI